MARKRMIDPDFWTDEALGECEPIERLLFMGLISQSDDEGRLRGSPSLIRSQVFPYDDDTNSGDVSDMLAVLARHRLIVCYQAGAQDYIWIRNFSKHQTINKATASRLPPPPDPDDLVMPTVIVTDDDGSTTVGVQPKLREEKLREVKGREENTRVRATVSATPKTRIRDPVWDALVEACGAPAADTDEDNDFGKTAKQMRGVNATAEEIAAFRLWWYREHPAGTRLTHRCYRNHFGAFRTAPPRPPQITDLSNEVQAHLTTDLSDIREDYEAKVASRNRLSAQNGRSIGVISDAAGRGNREARAQPHVLPPPSRSG